MPMLAQPAQQAATRVRPRHPTHAHLALQDTRSPPVRVLLARLVWVPSTATQPRHVASHAVPTVRPVRRLATFVFHARLALLSATVLALRRVRPEQILRWQATPEHARQSQPVHVLLEHFK